MCLWCPVTADASDTSDTNDSGDSGDKKQVNFKSYDTSLMGTELEPSSISKKGGNQHSLTLH